MTATVFQVDFNSKQVVNKFVCGQKVEYYVCISCRNKYAKTKSDKSFVPYVGWEVEGKKQLLSYHLCKHCIEQMNELVK